MGNNGDTADLEELHCEAVVGYLGVGGCGEKYPSSLSTGRLKFAPNFGVHCRVGWGNLGSDLSR